MIKKFRKKPVIIEAIQLLRETWEEVCEFIESKSQYFGRGVFVHSDNTYSLEPKNFESDRIGVLIPTLEGNMLAIQGDWIIKGIQGEFYPCKPDIFESTYDEVI